MSLDDYLRDITRVPMLTCDEEIMLGNKVQNMIKVLRDNGLGEQILRNNIAASIESLQPEEKLAIKRGLKARDRMISANMRLVAAVVRRVETAQVHMSTQDLMQEGAIGLARAAEKFEPGRGYKFSTYAYWWIRQGIVRAGEHQEKTIRVPANVQKAVKQITETKANLSARLGKEPTILQIASEMKEDPERVKKILLLDVAAISLDCGFESGSDQSSLLDVMFFDQGEDPEDQEESLIRVEFATKLIDALPSEDRDLIRQRYGIGTDPLTIKEIAIANETSQRSIKEKHEKIVSKIKVVAKIFAPENFH
jgi:RNA polymerase sigma factor (sigma-70 family)